MARWKSPKRYAACAPKSGLHQSQFAKMCKISVRTLVHIEHGEGNQTLKSLNAVFRPFGLKMGVMKVRRRL